MQRVISRVHQIVTASNTPPQEDDAHDDGSLHISVDPHTASASSRVPPAAAAASASHGPMSPASPASAPSSLPPPVAISTKRKEITLVVERLQYATLLSERKKAVASLHEQARSYTTMSDSGLRKGTPDHVALGLEAIPVVLHALLSDPRDTELMEAMLELLQDLVATSPSTAVAMLQAPETSKTTSPSHGSLRSAAAAAAQVSVSGTQICLQLLQDPSPWIRGPTISLVKALQEARQKEFAASVLECKEGLRRLLEVVEDKRDHIRDAALQVLVKMTEKEKNVQQFLAFEDGFVRLFQIMESEGGLHEGSSVVSDCLQIITNMLRDNLMNQTLFRDLPYLATHLPVLLSLPSATSATETASELETEGVAPSALKSVQKKRTMKLALQLVRFLVASLHEGVPENKLDELAAREKARKDQELVQIQSQITRQRELMGAIGEIVCCGNEALTDLQLQALDLIQLLCQGNGGNQIILVNLQTLPSRRSLLSELIKLDIAEEETPVGAAATHLLDVLFTKNESAKMAIFQHINAPPPIDDEDDDGSEPPVPAGRVLLDAVITNAEAIMSSNTKKETRANTIRAWKACHRFVSLIADSAYCKELALRVPSQFEKPDAQAVPGDLFLTRCLRLLGSTFTGSAAPTSCVFQVKIVFLTLLIQWCINCTNAVKEIVGSVTNLSILVDMLAPENDTKDGNSTTMSKDEDVQARGLAAMLLGACLEYLVPPPDAAGDVAKSVPNAASAAPVTPQLTRQKLLDLISKRVGLERFTNALIHFQQSPQVIACARAANKHQRARLLLPHQALYSGEQVDGDEGGEGYLFPLYDRSFTVLCRDLADQIQHRVLSIFTSPDDEDVHMGSGGGMNGPSAASAYQDLIRMQDKQIQELQRQVADLTTQVKATETVSGDSHKSDSTSPETAEAASKLEREVTELRTRHQQEKQELELKLAAMTEHSDALETRFQGLSRAFEQLEAEHLTCAAKARHGYSATSSQAGAPPTDAIGKVMADLERETAERRRLEEDLRQETRERLEMERKSSHDTHAWEMAKLQLQQDMEELRQGLKEKEELLNDQLEMLEVYRLGQESAKRSAAQAKLELERLQAQHTAKEATPEAVAASSSDHDSKHEAAAKEMYQLWEKERVKVRDLKADVAKMEQEKASAQARCCELEKQLNDLQNELAETAQVTAATETPEAETSIKGLSEEVAQLKSELVRVQAELKETIDERDELLESTKQQLGDIEQLRGLFEEMEIAANEAAQRIAQKDAVAASLKEQLAQVEEKAREQKRKSKKTVAELEEEIARMFFEKTEQHRKSKASLKQAENEIARMFLEKVDLEKQLAALQPGSRGRSGDGSASNDSSFISESEDATGSHVSSGEVSSADGEHSKARQADETTTAMEDMFILVASLEIQCNTFRECLESAKGEQAVRTAVELSRKRGAMVI